MKRTLVLALVTLGCTAEPAREESLIPHDTATDSGGGGVEPTFSSTAPTDIANADAVPVSGGTLLITSDGLWAVAADPDRDTVSIVGLSPEVPNCNACQYGPALVFTVQLEPGEEPGRLVEDGAGRVHVALRRGGAIATIDLASGQFLARRPVCGSPRGVAYDASTELLHVACASGELVSLIAYAGEPVRRLTLDVDLRDVIVQPNGLVVSRFKSAELLRLDTDGNVVARIKPYGIERISEDASPTTNDPIEPAVAWRTIETGGGGVAMLHQYALARPIGPEDPAGATAASSQTPQTYYTTPPSSCGGLVQAAISTLGPDYQLRMGMPIVARTLTVDAAVSPDGTSVALAHAGTAGVIEEGAITLVWSDDPPVSPGAPSHCALAPRTIAVPGQSTAVAFNPLFDDASDGSGIWLAVQTREPAQLLLYRDLASTPQVVELGGASALNTGHEIFHRDTGRGVACAVCHAEGAEDGRAWKFVLAAPPWALFGERRTQAINAGLEGTEPFHWVGDMADMHELVHEVLVGRMGGQLQSPERVEALARWLYTLTPPVPIVDSNAPEAVHGRALFESPIVGCADCHAGARLTNNQNYDVGVEPGQTFQVPSLIGIGYRAPFLHNGCAATLADRFAPPCGSDLHGKTSHLSSAEIGDLIAYLQSL